MKDYLLKIIDMFTQTTGMSAHIIDFEGNDIAKPPHRPEFCNIVRSGPNKDAFCKKSNILAAEKTKKEGKAILANCHCGLSNIALPLAIGGKDATFLIEHVRIKNIDKKKLKIHLQQTIKLEDQKVKEALISIKKVKQMTGLQDKNTAGMLTGILQRVQELFTLEEINKLLSSTLEIDKILNLILDQGLELIRQHKRDSHYVEDIALIDHKEGVLIIKDGRGPAYNHDEMKSCKLKIGEGITGYVAKTKEPYLCNDVSKDTHYYNIFPDTKAELAVPLLYQDEIIGVLNIESDELNAFTEADKGLLSALASQAAIAIRDARLHEQQKRTVKGLTTLNVIAEKVITHLDLSELFNSVVEAVTNILFAESCSLFIAEERKNLVLHATTSEYLKNKIGKANYEFGQGLTGHVAKTKEPLIVDSVTMHPQWEGRYPDIPEDKFRALLAVPLKGTQEVIGVIRVTNKKPVSPFHFPSKKFTEEDQELLTTLANQISVAIESATLLDNLKKSDEARKDFLSDLSHEIHSPLTTVKGLSMMLLKDEIKNPEKRKKYLEAIYKENEYFIQLMENTMSLSRIEVGRFEIKRTQLELNKIVKEEIKFLEFLAGEKNIKLEIKLLDTLSPIYGNEDMIKQILRNLLLNSINYSDKGKSVTIEIRENRKVVYISVIDEGIGITKQDMPNIFNKFSRGDNARAKTDGTGIGLHIVKYLVEHHSGEIKVKSEVNKGTTVTFSLPKYEGGINNDKEDIGSGRQR